MSVCLQEVLSYKIVLSYHNPSNVKAAILILLTKYPGLDTKFHGIDFGSQGLSELGLLYTFYLSKFCNQSKICLKKKVT